MSIHFASVSPRVLGAPADGAVLIAPVPTEVPMPDCGSSPAPSAVYHYCTAAGELMAIVARYDMGDGKRFAPYSLWRDPDGTANWHRKGLGDNRPLYRLPALVAAPNKPIMLVEGEKCADAVAGLDGWVGTTWMGGAQALAKTDFSPLAGRSVMIMPDLDAPGAGAAQRLVEILREVGAAEVTLCDTARLATEMGAKDPQGYDIADAIKAGLTEARFADLIARDGWTQTVIGERDPFLREIAHRFGQAPKMPEGFALTEHGVLKGEIDRHGMVRDIFVCSPLIVLGRTRTDRNGAGWGYMVALRSPDAAWITTVVPTRMLAGDGREFRELVGALGVTLPQCRSTRQALSEYISYAQHDRIIEVASRPGWHGKAFALHDRVVHPEGPGPEVMINFAGRQALFGEAGSKEEWTKAAALAEHNSRAAFAICVALSGPLLRLLGMGGGGFHLFGRSSRGKTTLLILAGSVWGGGGPDGFAQSWRVTDNGAEAIVAEHNDTFLAFDESSHLAPEMAQELTFLLADGIGKGRSNVDGSARGSAQWVVPMLSSGEAAFDDMVSITGAKKRTGSGHTVRMIDVPIEVRPGESFETLHGRSSQREFATEISTLAMANYGFAGPAFVRELVECREGAISYAGTAVADLVAELHEDGDDAQLGRVARRFAVAAAAGRLASDLGILPWDRGSAEAAAKICYATWKEHRGTNASHEEKKAARALQAFFELHGTSRFEPIGEVSSENDVPGRESQHGVYNRCGYRRQDPDHGTVYYVLPESWRTEICGENNSDLMLKYAQKYGALELGEKGRTQKKVRLPDYPQGTRVYVIRPALLP